jgi:uncharacterized protein YbaP (TraB family)
MEWRSQQVETILGQSQELVTEPGASLGVGFFRSLTLLPFMIGMEDNPDGRTLRDLMPTDTYEHWLVLRRKYLKDDASYDRKRPLFAAQQLSQKAVAAAGLSFKSEASMQIVQMAKKGRLKVTSPSVNLPVDSPVKALREFKKTPLEDAACFAKTIDRVETDVAALRARANAWAKGDIAAIRALDFSEQEATCLNAMQNSALFKEHGWGDIDQRMRTAWIDTVEKALDANQSTFAILPIKHILGNQAYLAALEKKGYKVEQPE